MAGPLPKSPETRQRRNKRATRAVLSTEEAPRQRAPRLPSDTNWHKLTRDWWRDVWRSPMAAEYCQADVHGLYILAYLVDRFWSEPATALAAEIRLQQQGFGLTPIDRKRLEWTVERVEEASRRQGQRRVRQAQSGELDPREALRQVK